MKLKEFIPPGRGARVQNFTILLHFLNVFLLGNGQGQIQEFGAKTYYLARFSPITPLPLVRSANDVACQSDLTPPPVSGKACA